MAKDKGAVGRYIRENSIIYIMLISAFVIGVLLGSLSVNTITQQQAENTYSFFNKGFEYIKNNNLNAYDCFMTSLKMNSIWIVLLWIFGLYPIGIPLIIFEMGFKGYTLGFSSAFLLKFYGMKGFLMLISSILPQTLIILPAFLVLCAFCIKYPLKKMRSKNRENLFKSYTICFLLVTFIIFVGVALESMLLPVLTKLFLSN